MIYRDYLIVGAGVGGASVCEGLRKHDARGSVMLVGEEPQPPYDRRRLFASLLAKNAAPIEKLLHAKSAWYDKKKIELRLDTAVTQFNIERRIAVLATGHAVEFRKACLATGSKPLRPAVAGNDLGKVLYIRTIRDVLALREIAEDEKNIVIIGSGFIAAEAASHLRQLKLNVTLMNHDQHLWQHLLDAETAEWLTDYFNAKSVTMKMQQSLNGFEGKTVLKNIQTKSGERFPAGLAVVALGAEPNLDIVRGTPLSSPGGTPVNSYLETDEKGIYAVGDVALYPDRIFGGTRRTEFWENAVEQGRVAGANITGKKRVKFEYVPYRSSRLFDLHIELVGDFSRPPLRSQIEGDRKKKKFIVKHFEGTKLRAVVLCNQESSQADKARREILRAHGW